MLYEWLDSDIGEAKSEQARYLLQVRTDYRAALAKNMLIGLGSGLLVGLVATLMITFFASYQPALRTILLSNVALALFGAYFGFVYESQPTDKAWMHIATNERAEREGRNRSQ
jgi:uncharacterized protein YacL